MNVTYKSNSGKYFHEILECGFVNLLGFYIDMVDMALAMMLLSGIPIKAFIN